ncbi:MAG TPA: UDP-N-acetylmuramoyl-L-alanyl-D-glutamate--2,6-diaminopimelate ligase, partial [bacterium]|nr:UDP-N-acetylmuramoyl-L-alanyl-D-glutamate--2,6-diaminopimelate ligase [bacterium]
MGEAAGSLSDVAIVTSDNPRTENPEKIIEDILPGLSSSASEFSGENGYLIIEDRREAIAKAAAIARSGDILVVAGKGHEDYQIIGDQKRHFDDREVLEEILSI